ncbi:MAG: RNA methyltransferase [Parvularculaceae bacterium]|jgi:TrmH family RNA methyltransferase|nr:RNA methyltransferase [Parvularculaceae bacterium]
MTKPAIREIASPSNPLIKDIKALHLKKRRDESGLFIAEGARSVIEALDCGAPPRFLIYSKEAGGGETIRQLRERTVAAGGEVLEVGAAILEKLARKDNPQSVLGVFRQRYLDLSRLDPNAARVFVALECVKDPGNLGTIIRTVDSIAAGGVILVGTTCDPYSVEAVRASMGSIFSVPLWRADEAAFLKICRDFPGVVVGTALQSSTDYRAALYRRPTLLVMGTEQAGLSEAARAACGALVKLPMKGRADSLNLAVSTGIMLYHLDDVLSRPD